jgi:hypothetical protein
VSVPIKGHNHAESATQGLRAGAEGRAELDVGTSCTWGKRQGTPKEERRRAAMAEQRNAARARSLQGIRREMGRAGELGCARHGRARKGRFTAGRTLGVQEARLVAYVRREQRKSCARGRRSRRERPARMKLSGGRRAGSKVLGRNAGEQGSGRRGHERRARTGRKKLGARPWKKRRRKQGHSEPRGDPAGRRSWSRSVWR